MSKTTKKQVGDFGVTCSSIISGVITFFLFLLVMVFPLIYDNSYVNILETKYQCYYLIVIGMVVVSLVLGIVMMLVDFNEFKGEYTKEWFRSISPKNWKTTLSVADWAVLIFWIAALISTLQSDYLFESFWGNEGRYTGLFLLTLYVVSYFLISRCWEVKRWMLELFLVSGMIVCLIGITDYFQLDILKFRIHIRPEQSTIFTSTLGNINTYTAYVAMVMGFAAASFVTEKRAARAVWYYICMMISFVAIIMGCSDNAYLALGALFVLLPFLAFGSWDGILRYLVMTASFFTSIQLIDWINQAFADMVIGLDSLFQVLAGFGGMLFVVAALWGAAAGMYLYMKKHDKWNAALGKRPVQIWGVVTAVGVLAVCGMLIDANVAGNGERYGALGNYLVFSDSWGTNRGYIWRKSLELYREFPILHKLFGFGPDTFGILTTEEIKFEMINATGQVFDNAHNEYLNLLVTIGPIGMVSYVAFLVSALWRQGKNWKLQPYLLGCVIAVACYSFQALVNLNLPVVTPMMWFLLSVGMSGVGDAAEAR